MFFCYYTPFNLRQLSDDLTTPSPITYLPAYLASSPVLTTMADSKSDDFATRRPSPSFQDIEKGGFRPRSAAASPLPSKRPAFDTLPESVTKITNNAPLSILAYCLSSISMTLVNKYVVSGRFWNMTFFYLTVQASSFVPVSGVGIVSLTLRRQSFALSPFWLANILGLLHTCHLSTRTVQDNVSNSFSVPYY